MTIEQFVPSAGITVSDTAVAHIRRELAKHADCKGMRIYLETAGCSGYMYETKLVESANEDDEVFQVADDVAVFVSKKDLLILNGTKIDFVTRGLNSMFHFENPNATAECGCGESFTTS